MSCEYSLLPLSDNLFYSMSDDENTPRTSRFLEPSEHLNQWSLKDFNVIIASKDKRDAYIRYKNWEYKEKNGGDL
jgi:hypothetical protein